MNAPEYIFLVSDLTSERRFASHVASIVDHSIFALYSLHHFISEFSNKYFTHVFIDEAAQCSECEAMIPITSINPDGGQIILAGDPLQLPPISLSNHSKHYNLVASMLQRYLDMYQTMDGIKTVCLN